jgi:hypothetical protein
MRNADLNASAAKLELALKTFRTTFAAVDPQWTDAARRDFQETYLEPMEPKVKNMLQAITRLAGVLAGAERQCGSD